MNTRQLLHTTLTAFFFLCSSVGHGYVLSKNSSGRPLKWAKADGRVHFYVNPKNSSGMHESDVLNVISKSIDQWDQAASLRLEMKTTSSSTLNNNRNNLMFSDDSIYFTGTGVAGLTMTVSREGSGEIIRSDIILNDYFSFSASSTDVDKYNYLGNVVTHEIGHAIGLDHGQTYRSSMFFEMARYQHILHSDDRAATQVHYPKLSNKGTIRGRVIGGADRIPVFGSYVEAISETTGRPVAGAVSNAEGEFRIRGLPRGDRYFIKVGPLKNLNSLPEIFGDVKKDFCHSRGDYTTSFYQTCQTRDEGHPQLFDLTSSSLNIGSISIRCSLDSPHEYRINKDIGYLMDLFTAQEGVGGSFIGYFTNSEVEGGKEDLIELDLRDYIVEEPELYLRAVFTTQDFFSKIMLEVDAYRNSIAMGSFPDYSLGAGPQFNDIGQVSSQVEFFLPLSPHQDENFFRLDVHPSFIEDFADQHPGVSYLDYFPSGGVFEERNLFYFATFQIVKMNIFGDVVEVVDPVHRTNTDNAMCPGAPDTYRVTPRRYIQQNEDGQREQNLGGATSDLPIACGTIALLDGKGPPSGPGPLPLIVLTPMLLCLIVRSRRQELSFCS